jgi:hypothetical protein
LPSPFSIGYGRLALRTTDSISAMVTPCLVA